MDNIEKQIDARHARRLHAEDRFLGRVAAREAKAARLIGELCREGRTVYYVWPAGGKYRESNSWVVLCDFLVRNQYVR